MEVIKTREIKDIVFPGDTIEIDQLKPRNGIHRDDQSVCTSQYFGVIQKGEEFIDVVPFNGPYSPRRGDKIIGKVLEVGPSMWTVDMKSPYLAMLHMNDTPWRTYAGELRKFLVAGDYIFAKIMNLNEVKESWITMKEPGIGLRKLEGGTVISIPTPKVPRIIGKNGAMINMIKDATGTRIIIGQNGLIWIDGEPDHVEKAIEALRIIEREAHTNELTERIAEFLKDNKGEIDGNTQ